MITYHPNSWSAQARSFANNIYESGIWMVEHGEWTEAQRRQEMIKSFQQSYRNKLIVYRAAKRAHRKGW